MQRVQIGTTDPAGLHRDERITRTEDRIGDVFDDQSASTGDGGSHRGETTRVVRGERLEPNHRVSGLDMSKGRTGAARTGSNTAMTQPATTHLQPLQRPTRTDFAAFYASEWPGAVRLAGLLSQDARVAEDLAQEAFARVFPKWERVENPHAYLRVAIVNACRSWQSRRRTERVKLPLVAVYGSAELGFDALADAVAALPYRQRAALVLRYYADLRESEIAEAIGCRPGTVKSLTSRALAALRKEVQQ
jgi:RNA polymerase sigma-70 factor (sigma-E family)